MVKTSPKIIAARKRPRFSFVIPVYDRTRLLLECVRSCLNQTYSDFEIVIVTDGSPSDTLTVVADLQHETRIRVFTYPAPFGTACRARNRGIQESRGEYVCFLDSDDLCDPQRLAITDRLISETGADVIYGAVRFIVDEGRSISGISFGDLALPNKSGFTLADLIAANQIYTLTVSVRREVLLRCGGFRLEMRYREDYELWLRLLYQGASFCQTQSVLSLYRIHGGNNELNFKNDDDLWHEKALDLYRSPFVQWS